MSFKIAVDAMGGDNSPGVEVAGAVAACRNWGCEVVLVGQTEQIEAELDQHDTTGLVLETHHASQVVGMHDSPSDVVRKKRDSSIRVAFDLAKQGDACAVVSAGNSGAIMASGMSVFGRVKGLSVRQSELRCPTLTTRRWFSTWGPTSTASPRSFISLPLWEAFMLSTCSASRRLVSVFFPMVQKKKGNDLTREAHQLLKGRVELPGICRRW